MNKKIVLSIFIILIITCGIFYKINYNNKSQERYNEIKESVKIAVERNIRAQFPGCSISKEYK